MLEWLVKEVPNASSILFTASFFALAVAAIAAGWLFVRSRKAITIRKLDWKEAGRSLWKIAAALIILQAVLWLIILQIDSETRAVPKNKLVIIEVDDFWSLDGDYFEGRGYSIENYDSVLGIIEKHNYTATLAVTPYIFIEDNTDILALRDDEGTVAYLNSKKAMGYEIAMHGYAHCRNTFYCPDVEENYLNILEGKKELDRMFDQETVTYLPPGNFWDDVQYNNVKRNRLKIIGNTRILRPYWDGNVLITPRGYDVVERWDWYGGNYAHYPYTDWVGAYEQTDFFILQLHCNTFTSQGKLDDLDRFLDRLDEDNATVVTYFEAYKLMKKGG
jgi:peptidoglycan/xylan/chitin deacetylase (PgdA/CDA1 family)